MTQQTPVPVPAAPDPNSDSTEPLLSVGAVTTLASAVLSLLVLFGLRLSPDAQATILTVIGVLAPVIVAVWGRRKVYSPASVATLLAAARRKSP